MSGNAADRMLGSVAAQYERENQTRDADQGDRNQENECPWRKCIEQGLCEHRQEGASQHGHDQSSRPLALPDDHCEACPGEQHQEELARDERQEVAHEALVMST